MDPTIKVETAISRCKEEADKMFFDVLGRKDKADKTRNALTVLNR
jgi:exocyst complex component 2